ncbi:MAG: hypothetical protein IJZ62_03865 [Clostridia bacterium]|nr:hypothetical protein [Clostridia bacterium]
MNKDDQIELLKMKLEVYEGVLSDLMKEQLYCSDPYLIPADYLPILEKYERLRYNCAYQITQLQKDRG